MAKGPLGGSGVGTGNRAGRLVEIAKTRRVESSPANRQPLGKEMLFGLRFFPQVMRLARNTHTVMAYKGNICQRVPSRNPCKITIINARAGNKFITSGRLRPVNGQIIWIVRMMGNMISKRRILFPWQDGSTLVFWGCSA